MEKFLNFLISAEKTIKTADHLVYITYPLIKDKRLLLKVLDEIKNAITNCISSILQYEYLYKRINLYKNPRENFRIFSEKCAPSYGISDLQIELILELFDFIEKHKESSIEFIREDKIVILSSNLKPKILTLEKTKEFLILAKDIIKKAKERIIV